MTSTYNSLVKQLSNTNQETLDLIDYAKNIHELPDPGFANWESMCLTTDKELKKNILRIAVVGTIKSGKSTFVNSIFGKDYLKRGAGVLTSIVTRVRNGSQDQVTLFLKNWEEINHEIRAAMVLMPFIENKFDETEFDLRRQKDRDNLKFALDHLEYDQLITKNTRNRNAVLLSSYIDGYDLIKKYMNTKNIKLDKNCLSLHHPFVSSDNLSVYLKDVFLEIEGIEPGDGIEIADCQGSDSPNPLHLSMIQDYLNVAHLIVYVISSRTGIRQADIKFLSMIRRMGILDNILFVINSDLNEHESLENLKKVSSDIQENLFLICQTNHQVFTFSALQNLCKLPSKYAKTKESSICNTKLRAFEFSNEEHTRFRIFLNNKINQERCFLLTNNHTRKLKAISNNIHNWIQFNQDILTQNKSAIKTIMENMAMSRSELLGIKTTIEGSIKGAIDQIKKELFLDIDCFFGDKSRGITNNITQFIQMWQFSLDNLNGNVTNNLRGNLYKIFQEFKQDLEIYISEHINPDIIAFIQQEELKLVKCIESLSAPYILMFSNVLEKHNKKITDLELGKRRNYEPVKISKTPAIFKKPIKLSPLVSEIAKYPVKIKAKTVLHFSFGKIAQSLLRLCGVSNVRRQNPQSIVIKKTIDCIKKETKKTMTYQLKNYKENIKFQHITAIANMIAENLEQQISNHLNINSLELTELENLTKANNQRREKISEFLDHMNKISQRIKEKIRGISSLTYELTK